MKQFKIVAALTLIFCLLAACGSNNSQNASSPSPSQSASAQPSDNAGNDNAGNGNAADDQVYLVEGIRGLSNTYYTNWIKGGQNFAKSVGIDEDHFIIMENQGSSEKQLSDIKAIVARTNGNVVFNLDPNEANDVKAIAEFLDQHNVPFVTWWNKPDDLWPWDTKSWVMHITFDNFTSGYKTAEIAMQNMKTPYKGKIIAIQGLLGNTAAIERFEGFKAALEKYPDVELVSAQPADWSDTKAFQLMSNELVKTPDVDAVWTANDSMALGAIQALKAVGLAGKIPVTGVDGTPQMFDAIKNGEATATVLSDAYLQGGLGLAIALAAKKGELNVNELPKEKRAWMAEAEVITKENVDQFYNDFYVNEPNYSWDQEHFFDRFMGPVK